MKWLELGKELSTPNVWINFEHIARIEFQKEGSMLAATVITNKPGGSDRSIFRGLDAERIKVALDRVLPTISISDNNLPSYKQPVI